MTIAPGSVSTTSVRMHTIEHSPAFFTVNQLAEELDVTPRAIRFYEAKGLITPQRAGTTRVLSRRDRARLTGTGAG